MEKFPKNLPKIPDEKNNDKENFVNDKIYFVFQQHPELSNIGTKEQYSKYIEGIFPNSRMKEILYHGTNNQFDDFSMGKNRNGIYFSPNKDLSIRYGKIIKSVVLNIEKPKESIFSSHKLYRSESPEEREQEAKHFVDNIGLQNKDNNPEVDGIIGIDTDGTNTEIAVWDKNQIHVLGSPSDIEEFRKFVYSK